MTGDKKVPKKKYPPEMNYSIVLKGMGRTSPIDVTFHLLMAILLITGLIIDLLGPWLGGWLSSIRSIAHGYVGALFVLVFIVYLIKVAYSKKMRTVLTVTNYVDFLFYIILTVTGITMASVNWPWINLVPELADALSSIAVYAPAVHVALTYVWIVFSTVFPGGILHGLASVYLISHLKKKYKNRRSRVR
ncbi:MAG: hypothetical protein JSV12_08645 [Candidatus Bathyarchaeota archaeon]|nr:MAG: hypothetical protein JSV12_08645 [Candidatus Bathyarchaeota archaeon]